MSDPVLFPPMPRPDDLTRFFWEGVADRRFLVQRCDGCGKLLHPPKVACHSCLGTRFTPTELSGRATLVTWTQPMVGIPDAFHRSIAPYVVAAVNLVEQDPLRFVTRIVDCAESDLRIDLPLVVTYREVAPGCTLPLFAPDTSEVR